MTTESKKKRHILIKGITASGEKFRPSDWAERVCGKLSTFKGRRMYYSPLLHPILKDGRKCILIDPDLATSNPKLFETIINFAHNNNLQIEEQEL